MEAINISMRQRPSKKDWQTTIQRRGYSADFSYSDTFAKAINQVHEILLKDCEEFDGKPVE